MALNKRGVFFTFVAFIFLGLLVMALSVGNNFSLRQKSLVVESRVGSMDNFVDDLEVDIQRAAYISGFRSFIGLEDYIVSEGRYVSDLDSSFEELFLHGSLYGENLTVLEDNSFLDWVDKISAKASEIGIASVFSINNVSVSHDDPWSVRIDIDLYLNVSDDQSISRWDKHEVITSHVDIEGLEDPFYVLGTNGLVSHRFLVSNTTDFVDGSDISVLLNHSYGGFYVSFAGAPSYLMRLQGNFSSSPFGVESLVDKSLLSLYGVPLEDKSIVDYFYFGPENPFSWHVSGAPSWFKLDNRSDGNQTHHQFYEVSGLV